MLFGVASGTARPRELHSRVHGVDVCDPDIEEAANPVGRDVGLVFQESFLFSNTVAANIAFGHPNATREEIERAATIAAAHEFIINLPKGYDTLLGEGGKDLSGGQRQRLAIARALLLDPAILLLDDPTAAVDPDTEKEILEAIENAMRGRTTFIVANRMSTLRRAHRILVLEDGRIVQVGTHDELIGPERGIPSHGGTAVCHPMKTALTRFAAKTSMR